MPYKALKGLIRPLRAFSKKTSDGNRRSIGDILWKTVKNYGIEKCHESASENCVEALRDPREQIII